MRPEVRSLFVSGSPAPWRSLGFAVAGETLLVGGVTIHLGAPGRGIVGWSLSGVEAAEIDGLPCLAAESGAPAQAHAHPHPRPHPNGVIAIDSLVALTPDFDRTAGALDGSGLGLRRIRDAGGFRQGFRRVGPVILELVEARDAPAGPASFWGLTFVAEDLEPLAGRLGEALSAVRPAVQPGRRIAALRDIAGLPCAIAFMDPDGSPGSGAGAPPPSPGASSPARG